MSSVASTTGKILFVLSSHSTFLNGEPTGWYLPEAAHPYHVVTNAGYTVDFASPKGGASPLDPVSVENFKDDISVAFLNGAVTKKAVAETLKLSDVDEKEYAAIFYVGGHGPCFDLAIDPVSIALAETFFASGRPVAAVCHGPAALHLVKDTKTGKSIFKGRRVTSFSNEEEAQINLTEAIPFLVETDIRNQGGIFVLEREHWGVEVVVDTQGGILITGANPASAEETGKAIVAALAN